MQKMYWLLKYLPVSKTGDLSVKVTDGTDAISGVSIFVDDDETASGTTNSDGEATIEDVTGGNHTLTFSKEGYVTTTETVTVDGDIEVEVEMIATRSVSFTVQDSQDTPVAIQGAEVVIDGDIENKKTTGSSGGCSATLPDGEHEVVVSAEGFTTKTETITVDSTHASFTISLTAS